MSSRSLVPVLVGMMLLTGVCNTLLTKYQDLQCVADCTTKKPKMFEQPVIQTLQMFVGESGCWLVIFGNFLVRRFKNRRTSDGTAAIAYQPVQSQEPSSESPVESEEEEHETDLSSSQTLVDPTNVVAKPLVNEELGKERIPLTGWKIAMLALPAICDILGTTLMNAGLLLVAASIYQMTRGALVLFVGLFSVLFLKRHLSAAKWGSLFIVVIGVAIVGLAGFLDKKGQPGQPDLPGDTIPPPSEGADSFRDLGLVNRSDAVSAQAAHTAAETVLGVVMIAGAQIFTATQFVFEESIMDRYSMEPIQVVGWEGIFGFAVTLIAMGVLHAAVGRTEAGQGAYFDAREGFYQMFHYPSIGITSILIMISIGGFNFFGLSVTRVISATSRSTIDTCRTLFIWLVSLGLGWETFKWLQVLGFALLVWGTGVFNDVIRMPTQDYMRRRIRWRRSPPE